METRCSEVFVPFRKRWYNKERKIVPDSLNLTPLVIAIWFMDDGCISIPYKNKKDKKNNFIIRFATNSFSHKEVVFLSDLLSRRYDSDFYPVKTSSGYVVQGGHYATLKLMEDIIDHIPMCMSRKYDQYELNSNE